MKVSGWFHVSCGSDGYGTINYDEEKYQTEYDEK
jgi:hypothetical protein